MVSQLDEFQNLVIKKNHQAYVYLRKIVILRRELRFIWVEIFIYTMRLVLLTSSLKLVGHSWLHPIFVSCCGLSQAMSVVFKSMKSKKNFYKLEVDDLKGDCSTLQNQASCSKQGGTHKHQIVFSGQQSDQDGKLHNDKLKLYEGVEMTQQTLEKIVQLPALQSDQKSYSIRSAGKALQVLEGSSIESPKQDVKNFDSSTEELRAIKDDQIQEQSANKRSSLV